jgi:hypothetical protein
VLYTQKEWMRKKARAVALGAGGRSGGGGGGVGPLTLQQLRDLGAAF